MRILFVIVIVFGVALTGLSICGIRIANEHLATDQDVQQELKTLSKHAPGSSTDYLAGVQEASLDDINLIKKGWAAVLFAGISLFIAGIAGVIIQRRRPVENLPPNKSLQPTATAPSVSTNK
jgi:hypothetical protein